MFVLISHSKISNNPMSGFLNQIALYIISESMPYSSPSGRQAIKKGIEVPLIAILCYEFRLQPTIYLLGTHGPAPHLFLWSKENFFP